MVKSTTIYALYRMQHFTLPCNILYYVLICIIHYILYRTLHFTFSYPNTVILHAFIGTKYYAVTCIIPSHESLSTMQYIEHFILLYHALYYILCSSAVVSLGDSHTGRSVGGVTHLSYTTSLGFSPL